MGVRKSWLLVARPIWQLKLCAQNALPCWGHPTQSLHAAPTIRSPPTVIALLVVTCYATAVWFPSPSYPCLPSLTSRGQEQNITIITVLPHGSKCQLPALTNSAKLIGFPVSRNVVMLKISEGAGREQHKAFLEIFIPNFHPCVNV